MFRENLMSLFMLSSWTMRPWGITNKYSPGQFLQMVERGRGDHCQHTRRPNYGGRDAMSVEWFPLQSHPVRQVQPVCCYCRPRLRVGGVCLDEVLVHP